MIACCIISGDILDAVGARLLVTLRPCGGSTFRPSSRWNCTEELMPMRLHDAGKARVRLKVDEVPAHALPPAPDS